MFVCLLFINSINFCILLVFIKTLATLLIKDQHGIIIILYNTNQLLWYQKLHRSILQSIKKLYCQIKFVDDSLDMFPEHSDFSTPPIFSSSSSTSFSFSINNNADQQCYHLSCGFCCDCADSIGLESIYKRLIFLPKMQQDEYLSILPHV